MILAGLGAARIVDVAGRYRAQWSVAVALACLAVVQFALYVPLVRSADDTAWAARADVSFARSFVPDLAGRTYVLTHNPGMFHVWGVGAGQMSLAAADPSLLDRLAGRYPDGVYVHWNFWCNTQDRIQQEFCTRVLSLGHFEVVREHRERDQRLAFYRLQ
jgi:hypothetical protein